MTFVTNHFAIDILVSLAAGFIIGAEREARGKAAGISTNYLAAL